MMSGKMHALLALFTCGLWLLIAPAIYWLRKGAYKPAAAWVTAWVLLPLPRRALCRQNLRQEPGAVVPHTGICAGGRP